MILDALVAAALVLGSLLCALSGLGVLRMPDMLTRMQASAKTGTLGVALIALACALWWAPVASRESEASALELIARCAFVVVFLMLTAPVGAHVIARAAHRRATPLSPRTRVDQLRDADATRHIARQAERPPGTAPAER